jgi:hypothetical protein
MLPLWRPWDEVVTEVNVQARHGTSSVGAADLVSVGVGDYGVWWSRMKLESMRYRSLDVAQDALNGYQVLLMRIVHVKAHLKELCPRGK